jgi:hypothetical protein
MIGLRPLPLAMHHMFCFSKKRCAFHFLYGFAAYFVLLHATSYVRAYLVFNPGQQGQGCHMNILMLPLLMLGNTEG